MDTSYIPYLTLVLYVCASIFNLIGIFKWGQILLHMYRKQDKHLKLSHLFLVYLFTNFFLSFCQWFHTTYMVVMWRLENAYSAYWIYWTNVASFPFTTTINAILFFLTIDRCLILTFPMKYSELHKRRTFKLAIVGMLVIASGNEYAAYWDYPVGWETACRVGGCVFPTLMLVYAPTKLIFAFFNIIIGACFFYFLTKYNKNHGSSNNDEVAQRKRKINSLIKYNICIELIFSFIPYSADFLVRLFFGFNISKYIGPYSNFLMALDGCICSILYVAKLVQSSHSSSKIFTIRTKSVTQKQSRTHTQTL